MLGACVVEAPRQRRGAVAFGGELRRRRRERRLRGGEVSLERGVSLRELCIDGRRLLIRNREMHPFRAKPRERIAQRRDLRRTFGVHRVHLVPPLALRLAHRALHSKVNAALEFFRFFGGPIRYASFTYGGLLRGCDDDVPYGVRGGVGRPGYHDVGRRRWDGR